MSTSRGSGNENQIQDRGGERPRPRRRDRRHSGHHNGHHHNGGGNQGNNNPDPGRPNLGNLNLGQPPLFWIAVQPVQGGVPLTQPPVQQPPAPAPEAQAAPITNTTINHHYHGNTVINNYDPNSRSNSTSEDARQRLENLQRDITTFLNEVWRSIDEPSRQTMQVRYEQFRDMFPDSELVQAVRNATAEGNAAGDGAGNGAGNGAGGLGTEMEM